jgi:hypothetical protein
MTTVSQYNALIHWEKLIPNAGTRGAELQQARGNQGRMQANLPSADAATFRDALADQDAKADTQASAAAPVEVAETPPPADIAATLQENLPPEKLDYWYIGVLGQSNALRMSARDGDEDSGQSVLRDRLDAAGVVDDVAVANYALGSSVADGDRYNKADTNSHLIWWHPDTGMPGQALTNALAGMRADVEALQAKSAAGENDGGRISIVWSQGETDAGMIAQGLTDAARYKGATLEIFRYIEDELDIPVDFYITQTGRYNAAEGISQSIIDRKNAGHAAVQQAQKELAEGHEHIHLAATTSRHDMADPLHLTTEAYERVGADLARYMEQDFRLMG